MKSVLEEARSAIWKFQEDIVVKFENNGLSFYFIFLFILFYFVLWKTKCDTVTGHMTGHKNHMFT